MTVCLCVKVSECVCVCVCNLKISGAHPFQKYGPARCGALGYNRLARILCRGTDSKATGRGWLGGNQSRRSSIRARHGTEEARSDSGIVNLAAIWRHNLVGQAVTSGLLVAAQLGLVDLGKGE